MRTWHWGEGRILVVSLLVVLIPALSMGCAAASDSQDPTGVREDGGISSDENESNADSRVTAPNRIPPDSVQALQTVDCSMNASDPSQSAVKIGRLRLSVPKWWEKEEVEVPDPGGFSDVLDQTIDAASTGDPGVVRWAIKSAALYEERYMENGLILGQVLAETEDLLAAGCVLAASYANSVEMTGLQDQGFQITYSAYQAGEAYESAGDGELSRAWFELASQNPGQDPDGQFYADEAAGKL